MRAACAFLFAAALLVAPAPAAAVKLTRGPYLQLLTTQTVTIVWGTDVSAACSLAIKPVAGVDTVLDGGTGTVCTIAVEGLVAGTEYAYVPRADGAALRAPAVFRTDDPNQPFVFGVLGDSGVGDDAQMRVRDRLLESPLAFLVHTGDMIYDDGQTSGFDPYFFRPYAPLLEKLVFWPCLGNHDIRTNGGAPWRSFFHTPANNAAASENYYSFDYGNAHVAVLNSNASTGVATAQYDFLEADLAASRARWKFVAFHHSIYSSGSHGSNITIRNNLVPLFDRYGVDIVFQGHEHHYERTVPLRANRAVAPGQGTIYITTGGGGKDLRPVGSSSFTAYSESAHHYTRVAIDGDTLEAEMVRSDGQVRDAVTVQKSGTPATTTTTTLRPTTTTLRPTTTTLRPTTTTLRATTTTTTTTTTTVRATTTTSRAVTSTTGAAATTTSQPAATTTSTIPVIGGGTASFHPIEDTYIEAGVEAAWDHGASDHLDIDVKPFGVTYLKFDLRSVPGPIELATLSLFCSNASADGGRIYPVRNSSWVEGNGTGIDGTSANGPGLKWTEVDTNRDGALTAADTSAFAPDLSRLVASLGPVVLGRTYTVDVTSAFQSGPGIYTLAIRNSTSDGSTFSSRNHPEATRRPVLRIRNGSSPGGCGDGARGGVEECDGADAASCPGLCRADCTCTPRPSPGVFPCLGQSGPTVMLSGTRTSTYSNRSLAADTKIDARATTFLAGPDHRFPMNLDGANGVCVAGGSVRGNFDRNWTWEQMHDMSNTGLRFLNKEFTVDGLRVDNMTDGVRPIDGPFTIRQAWFSYVRDDCVENDHVQPGLIEDSLFDGCYVGISERPSPTIEAEGYDGRDGVLTIRNTLIRLQPMRGPDGGSASDYGHGPFFKWHDLATKLALHNNVFMAEKSSRGNMGIPGRLESCSNNVMVWLGPGDYPASLPSCFTVTRDRGVWDRAVADWKARHPHVGG